MIVSARENTMSNQQTREDSWSAAMRSALKGDETSYAHLLGEIARVMRYTVGSWLSTRGFATADVEDIVQEILLGLHTKRNTWNEDRPILPWVYAIAHYKAVDGMRRLIRDNKVRSTATLDELALILSAPHFNEQHRPLEIERHLAGLSEREREIVRNIALNGESIKATAIRFSISEGAVRVAYHRGLSRISKGPSQ